MPISYGDIDGPPSDEDKKTKVKDVTGGAVADDQPRELIERSEIDPQASPLKAFLHQPLASGEEATEMPDRLGHLVGLTLADIDALSSEQEDNGAPDNEGDDFTFG